MSRVLVPRGFFLLLALTACHLPRNTHLQDWSQIASAAAERAAPVSDAMRAMQQALSIYLLALGTLADGADLTFDAAGFAALGPRAGTQDAAAAQAITRLGALLRDASDERPPRWLPQNNSGPGPAYEDGRLARTLRAGDAPVQALIDGIATAAARGASTGVTERAVVAARYMRLANAATDAAARQSALDGGEQRDRDFATRAADRARYAEILARIGEGHALLTSRAGRLTQEETARLLRAAEEQLQRAAARLS